MLRFPHAFYLLIAQPRHVAALNRALHTLAQRWKLDPTHDAGTTPVYRRST